MKRHCKRNAIFFCSMPGIGTVPTARSYADAVAPRIGNGGRLQQRKQVASLKGLCTHHSTIWAMANRASRHRRRAQAVARRLLTVPALVAMAPTTRISRLNRRPSSSRKNSQGPHPLPVMRKLTKRQTHWSKPIACGRQNTRLIKTDTQRSM